MVFWESVCGLIVERLPSRPPRHRGQTNMDSPSPQGRGACLDRFLPSVHHLIHSQAGEAAATQRIDHIGSPQPWHLSFQTSLLQLSQTINRFYSFITLQVAQITITTSILSITRTVYEFKAPHNWFLSYLLLRRSKETCLYPDNHGFIQRIHQDHRHRHYDCP